MFRSARSLDGSPYGSRRPALLAAGALGILGLLGLLSACELAVEVDIPEHNSRLVAHSFFAPDSAWTVRLRRSGDIEGRDNIRNLAVTAASVRITDENGNFSEPLAHIGEGIYGLPPNGLPGPGQADGPPSMHPAPGMTYTLEAEAPGLPAVRAVSSVPAATASMVEVERLSDASDGLFVFEHHRVRMRIEDPPGPNYYKLEVFAWVGLSLPGEQDVVWDFREIAFTTNEASFRYDDYAYFFDAPDIAAGEEFYGVLFSDELFDGETKAFDIVTEEDFLFSGMDVEPSIYRVELSALSEDYFQYHHTAYLQDETVGEVAIEAALFQTPPVHLHSNVEEGLGVFAGYAMHVFGFDAEGNTWEGEDAPE